MNKSGKKKDMNIASDGDFKHSKKASEFKKDETKTSNSNENLEENLELNPNHEEEINSLNNQLKEVENLNLRLKAEFSNFKKRTEKEKQELYISGKVDCISSLLPVLDSLERAVEALKGQGGELEKGVKLILTQFRGSLEKLGVLEIKSEGEVFNPSFHNAINVVEDENYEHNVVCKVFQKGYILNDVVVRHAAVVVANP